MVYVRLSRFTGLGLMLSLIAGSLPRAALCRWLSLTWAWALTILMPIWFIAHCISGLTRVVRLATRFTIISPCFSTFWPDLAL